jgi:chromosome segregation ATPase
VSDKELLGFFQEYFKSGSLSTENDAEKNTLIPAEINEKTAEETIQAVVNCLRTMQADAKSLQYALGILNEETAFHKQAAAFDTERLKEKCELETASLKPEVEKKVKKLTLKHDKTMASILKSNEKKVAAMEKKRETYMHKLQAAERKKDAVQKRISTSKKKGTSKSAYGAYELKKSDREIDNLKKEVKTISEALEKIRKEGENNAKNVEEEFRNAKALEEGKLAAIITAYDAKVKDKNKQIETMTIQAESITTAATNLMGELNRDGDALRQQVEIDWKLDNPNVAVLVHAPIYMVKYLKAKDERYSLISPLTISEDIGVLNGLRKILALNSEPKLKSLMRQASKKLHEMLTENVTEKMQKDGVFRSKISAVCRDNNLMDRTEFAEMLNEGLDEVVKRGWLTLEEAQTSCRHIMGAEA